MDRDEIESIALQAFKKGVYAKNLEYGFSTDANLEEFHAFKRIAGAPGMAAWLVQQIYRKRGSQLQVQKEVSDDLLASDFPLSSRIQDIIWPAECVELYFEDPAIPTILLGKIIPDELPSMFPGLHADLQASEYVSAMIQEGTGMGSKYLNIQLRPEQYDAFMLAGEVDTMKDKGIGVFTHDLNDQDHASLCILIHLAMKVFAFASIPHLKPVPISRKSMRFGGKPDVRGRPPRPASRVLYLPNVQYEYAGGGGGASGEHRAFHGRRGHFRFFHSERFVNKRGLWTLIRPVPAKDGTFPTRMKVRKP